jgi:transcription-repair coupling factor (superfamily II helicase)
MKSTSSLCLKKLKILMEVLSMMLMPINRTLESLLVSVSDWSSLKVIKMPKHRRKFNNLLRIE